MEQKSEFPDGQPDSPGA